MLLILEKLGIYESELVFFSFKIRSFCKHTFKGGRKFEEKSRNHIMCNF